MAKTKKMRNPNGYGSVFKVSRKIKKWVYGAQAPVTYDPVTMERKQFVIGYYDTRKEAMEQLAKWKIENGVGKSDTITLKAVYNKYLELKGAGKNKKWHSDQKTIFKHADTIQNEPIANLDLPKLQSYFNTLEISSITQNKIKILLNNLFKLAEDYDWISKNPVKSIVLDKSIPKKMEFKHSIYTDEELAKIIIGDTQSKRVQLFYLYTGLRFNEIFTISEVHLAERYFIAGSKTEAGRNRVIPIHKAIIPFFEEILALSKKYKDLKIRQIFTEDSLGHTPHDCRYTFITKMQKIGIKKVLYQKIVGHKGDDVTDDVYTSFTKEELIKAIDQFILL